MQACSLPDAFLLSLAAACGLEESAPSTDTMNRDRDEQWMPERRGWGETVLKDLYSYIILLSL